MTWIQQDVESLVNERGRHGQERRATRREPRVPNGAGQVRSFDPAFGKVACRDVPDRQVVWYLKCEETVTSREILDLDLEVHQRFEEGGGGTGGEIHDPPAARVPPA